MFPICFSSLKNLKSLIIITLKNYLLTLNSCLVKVKIWIKHLIKNNYFFFLSLIDWLCHHIFIDLCLTHDRGPYHTETSPLICNANQFTGFRIQNPVKQLRWSVWQKQSVNQLLQRKHFAKQICSYKTNFYPKVQFFFVQYIALIFADLFLSCHMNSGSRKEGKLLRAKKQSCRCDLFSCFQIRYSSISFFKEEFFT